MFSSQDLVVFVTVADSGSVSEAAQQLHRTQPAVSQKQLLERCGKVSEKLGYELGEYLATLYEVYRGPEAEPTSNTKRLSE